MKHLISIGGRTQVNPQEVVALVASVNYSLVYMANGRVIIVATTLKILENRFRSDIFFRPHKSFLINLQFVTDFDKQNLRFAEMENKLKVTISRRKRHFFLESIQPFFN